MAKSQNLNKQISDLAKELKKAQDDAKYELSKATRDLIKKYQKELLSDSRKKTQSEESFLRKAGRYEAKYAISADVAKFLDDKKKI